MKPLIPSMPRFENMTSISDGVYYVVKNAHHMHRMGHGLQSTLSSGLVYKALHGIADVIEDTLDFNFTGDAISDRIIYFNVGYELLNQ
jgi:hypothetical protein